MFDVIIIGGGLSGLAAAVKLSLAGANVVIYEQAPRLGGRCYSYIDETTGDVVDNGQHVLLGAYHNLLHYLDLIGTRRFLKNEPKLSMTFHHPENGRGKFEISSLPKPLHLTAGMLRFKLLSFKERQRLLKVGLELNKWNDDLEKKLRSLSIEQWLIRLKQSEEARKCLWYPIAVSAMNEIPEKASALLFARSLKAAFLGKKSDSAILIPTIGQSELYVYEAQKLIEKHHGKIYLNSEVESLEVKENKIIGVILKDGNLIRAKNVISTIMPHALTKLIPNPLKKEQPFSLLDKFETSPIVSINLWFDKEFMDVDYIGLIDRNLQWIFNRRKLMNESALVGKSTSYITAVISAAYKLVNLPKEELITLALKDIHDTFPESRKAKLLHSVIIKEKRATISATNEVEQLRPSPGTPIENFYLAGDWTNTGLPATIEGAVISGFKAAEMVKS
ncbi:MAG: hydroxysqualene dehydroxylase HpnE [Bacteroidota bacterium]|nr:hydroxysqualene dehydroxylase HpnE [Bacteroidota bacterium]